MIIDYFNYNDPYLPKNADACRYMSLNVDILELIRNHTDLEEDGPGVYVGFCPFTNHEEKRFTVNTKERAFECIDCNLYGEIFDFIKKIKNISYYDAVEWIFENYKENFGLRYTELIKAFIRSQRFNAKLLSYPVLKMIHPIRAMRKDSPRNNVTILKMRRYKE